MVKKLCLLKIILSRKAKNTQTKETYDINVPQSNVLIYYTENRTKYHELDQSETEPKIKFYISVDAELKSTKNIKKSLRCTMQKSNASSEELSIMLK